MAYKFMVALGLAGVLGLVVFPGCGGGSYQAFCEADCECRACTNKEYADCLSLAQEMDEYMTAADIVLGKPGGLTTSEGLSKGLAFAIVDPIPGQEERNSDHLLEAGVAIRSNNLPTLAYKLDRLLADGDRLSKMQSISKKMGRPNAARDIVRRVTEIS